MRLKHWKLLLIIGYLFSSIAVAKEAKSNSAFKKIMGGISTQRLMQGYEKYLRVRNKTASNKSQYLVPKVSKNSISFQVEGYHAVFSMRAFLTGEFYLNGKKFSPSRPEDAAKTTKEIETFLTNIGPMKKTSFIRPVGSILLSEAHATDDRGRHFMKFAFSCAHLLAMVSTSGRSIDDILKDVSSRFSFYTKTCQEAESYAEAYDLIIDNNARVLEDFYSMTSDEALQTDMGILMEDKGESACQYLTTFTQKISKERNGESFEASLLSEACQKMDEFDQCTKSSPYGAVIDHNLEGEVSPGSSGDAIIKDTSNEI